MCQKFSHIYVFLGHSCVCVFFVIAISVLRFSSSFTGASLDNTAHIVDRPNTTHSGQDRKTLTLSFFLMTTLFKALRFLYKSRGRSL